MTIIPSMVGLCVAIALVGAAASGCGGGGSGGGGGAGTGAGGASTGGEAPVTAAGTAVTETERENWRAAMEAFNAAAADGFTEAECAQLVQRFEQIDAQHSGGRFVEAIYMVGLTHERCGHAQQAQEYYDRVLGLNERFCGARVARGVRFYRQGNLQAARAEFERAVRDDSRCTEGYVNLAILQRRDPATQAEALNNLRRALAIQSSYLPAFNQMALLYYETALRRAQSSATVAGGTAAPSGAAQQQQQQESSESTAAARRAAARRAAAGQMLDLAEVVCRQAQLIDGNYAPIYNTWGLINVQQGNIIAALAKFERAFQLDPTFFEAFMNFGELTLSFRGYEDAERAFRRATELRPDSYDAWLGLGAALRGLNRTDEALAAYQRAQQIDANRAESYFNIGLLYADYMGGTREQRTQAQQFFRQFVERARGRPELADVVQSVVRECGCPESSSSASASRGGGSAAARRAAARARARAARRRASCQSGRIEAITCGFRLEEELAEIQRQAEQMQREIEAMAAQQQQQQGESGAPAPAQETTPPSQ